MGILVVFQECGHNQITSPPLRIRLGWAISMCKTAIEGKVYPGWCRNCVHAREDAYNFRESLYIPQRIGTRRKHPIFDALQRDGLIIAYPADHFNDQVKRKPLWHCWRCMRARKYRSPGRRDNTAGLCCHNRNARLEWDLWEACPKDDHWENKGRFWPPEQLPTVVRRVMKRPPLVSTLKQIIIADLWGSEAAGSDHLTEPNSQSVSQSQENSDDNWDRESEVSSLPSAWSVDSSASTVSAQSLPSRDEIILSPMFLVQQAQRDADGGEASSDSPLIPLYAQTISYFGPGHHLGELRVFGSKTLLGAQIPQHRHVNFEEKTLSRLQTPRHVVDIKIASGQHNDAFANAPPPAPRPRQRNHSVNTSVRREMRDAVIRDGILAAERVQNHQQSNLKSSQAASLAYLPPSGLLPIRPLRPGRQSIPSNLIPTPPPSPTTFSHFTNPSGRLVEHLHSVRSQPRTARSSSPLPIMKYTDDEFYALESAVAADRNLEVRQQPARRWQDDLGYYNSPEYANVTRITRPNLWSERQ